MKVTLCLLLMLSILVGCSSYRRPLVRVSEWDEETEKLGVIDTDGEVLLPPGQLDVVSAAGVGLAKVRQNGLMGIIDFNREWIVKPEYKSVRTYPDPALDGIGGPFYTAIIEETAENEATKELCEIRDFQSHTRLNKLELTWCAELRPDLFAVGTAESAGKVGFMNSNWEMEIPAQFARAGHFIDGFAEVKVTEEFTETICASDAPLKNEHIRASCEEYDNTYSYGSGFINRQGHLISRFDYHQVSGFSNGRARVKRYVDSGSYLYGYIDETGAEVIPPQFIWATDFSEGYAVVDATGGGGHAKIIDRDGNYFLDGICTAEPFSEGLASVAYSCNPTKQAYINTNGDVVIPDLGDGPFIAGHAWVYDPQHKSYGLLDKNGNWVLPYRLTKKTERYSDGLSQFSIPRNKETGEWKYREGWINPEGKIIWPPGWNDPCHENDVIVWPQGSCEQ